MLLLLVLVGLLQTPPQTPQAPLAVTQPNGRDRSRCLSAAELSRERMSVTLRCRVTSFGRATGCQPLDPPSLKREDMEVFECLARAHRFTATDGGSPARDVVDIPMSAANEIRL